MARGAATPRTRSRPHRVLVAEGSVMLRRALASLLSGQEALEVVGQVADARELLESARRLRPDVLLVDVQIPGQYEEVSRELLREVPGVSILTLNSSASMFDMSGALVGGTSGFVLKEAEPELLVAAIIAAAHGYAVSPRSVMQDVGRAWATSPQQLPNGLSPREFDVLRHLADGLTTKALANRLEISEKTVRNHIASMYEKLGLHDRPQLVRYAIRRGLSGSPEQV